MAASMFAPALATAGWLHQGAAALRNILFDRGVLPVCAAPIPVVSIGGLTFGGAGKTPTAIWFAALLAGAGHRVALVSRGYRGQRHEDPLVVARGGRLLSSARQAGDEAILLALDAPAHVVVVGRDRLAAATLAAREGATLALLDDGFQHRRLARTVDIVLLDERTLLERWPRTAADLLREPLGGLKRAELALVVRRGAAPASGAGWLAPADFPSPARERLERVLDGRPTPRLAAIVFRPCGVTLPGGQRAAPEALSGRRVLAVSGIARPERFHASLEQLNARVAAELVFADHHAYTAADAATIARRAAEARVDMVVTTAKDLVRWPADAPAPAVLRIEAFSPARDAVLDLVVDRLPRPAAG